MGGLLATWNHGDVQACPGAKGHVWVCSPDAAKVVCVDVQCLQIWMAYAAIHGHGEVQTKLQPRTTSLALLELGSLLLSVTHVAMKA